MRLQRWALMGGKGSGKSKSPEESGQLPSVASGAPLSWLAPAPWPGGLELLGELCFGAEVTCLTHLPRCVVVLFNPRKHKQHHILNSSR